MTKLVNLPALTAEELEVLGRAITDRLAVASSVMAVEVPTVKLREFWTEEAAALRSLATAVAEARYSLE